MNIDNAKQLQQLCTRHEIVKKVYDNWKSGAAITLTIMCLGNMFSVKRDIGIPLAHPGIGDDELARDIETALEAQLKRLEDQIAAF